MARRGPAVAAALAAVCSAGAAVAGCVGWAPHVRDVGQLGPDQVVLVGRLALDPPLEEGEQNASTIGGGAQGKIYALVDDRYRAIQGEPTMQDYRGGIEAGLGKPFFVAMPARDRYILAATIILSYHPEERAYFPGGVRIPVEPGDRAVYMGSLVYCRDEFFNVDRGLLIDEHAQAKAAFRDRFGESVALERRLAQPVDTLRGEDGAPISPGAHERAAEEEGVPMHYVPPGTRCADVPAAG